MQTRTLQAVFPESAVRFEGDRTFVATDRNHKTLRIRLVPREDVPEGTEFRLVMGAFRALRDNHPKKNEQWRNFQASAEPGPAPEVLSGTPHSFHEMASARISGEPARYAVGHVRFTEAMRGGTEILLEVDALLSHQAPFDAVFHAQGKAAGEADFGNIGEPIVLEGVPGPTVGIVARLKASAQDGAFRLYAHGRDAIWNPSEPSIDAGHLETEVVGRGEFRDGGLRPEGAEPVRLWVRDRRTGFETLTNPVVADEGDGCRAFFGEFHWHSRFADGDRPAAEGYRYARDVLGLDFAGVTDHTPEAIWAATRETNEAFNEPDSFTTMPAWEWSTSTGHSNIYPRTPDAPAGPEMADTADHPGNADWPEDAIVVPHHTNVRSENRKSDGSHYWHEFNWSLPNRRVRLCEITQTRGNFEADALDGDWGIVTSGIGASVRDALAMGYRIGFTGGTDNHTAFPTRSSQMGETYNGMTAIVAESNTREALWRAMDARRTYATSGVPILCRWTVNGLRMGEEGRYGGGGVRFAASLHGTAPIERIEVIADGRIVWRCHPHATDVHLAYEELPEPEGKGSWYYLRLRQFDGHRAWLSPIWLDLC